MRNRTLRSVALLFVVFALIHLTRLYFPFKVIIGIFCIPTWVSIIGYILFGLLSFSLFRVTDD